MSSVAKVDETEDGLNGAGKIPAKTGKIVVGALAVSLPALFFFMLFWNRFAGLRSGDGGFSAGVFFLKGILPYRDYYCATPPLFLLRTAAVLAMFGKLAIAVRGCGVFERIVLSLLLYGWLVRLFRVKDAAFAALVTLVVSTGDYADPVSSYNHFTILLAVAGGLAASYALDRGRSARALVMIGSLGGVLSQLCLDSKQTIGLGVTCAIPIVVCLCLAKLDGVRKAAQFLAGFGAGWMLAGAVLLGWMWRAGILHLFLLQAFVAGPKAKASQPGDFVLRTLMVMENYWWAPLIALGIVAIFYRTLCQPQNESQTNSVEDSLTAILLTSLLGLSSIVAPTIVTWRALIYLLHLPANFLLTEDLPAKPVIYATLIGSCLVSLHYLWQLLAGKVSRSQSQIALFASTAFMVAFMTSLSFPAFEAMTIPGLGLIVAVLLNGFRGWRRWTVYGCCWALMFGTVLFKEGMPFGFGDWLEPPVNAAVSRCSIPELRGFLLPAETVDFIESTVHIIEGFSSQSDTIFVYPELGLFYGLTERMPATFSASHNIDVVPDSFAKEEAQRLLRVRPAVLIYSPRSEQSLRGEEAYWRRGKPSGQRDLIAAVETLAREYRLVRVFRMYTLEEPVYIFARVDTVRTLISARPRE